MNSYVFFYILWRSYLLLIFYRLVNFLSIICILRGRLWSIIFGSFALAFCDGLLSSSAGSCFLLFLQLRYLEEEGQLNSTSSSGIAMNFIKRQGEGEMEGEVTSALLTLFFAAASLSAFSLSSFSPIVATLKIIMVTLGIRSPSYVNIRTYSTQGGEIWLDASTNRSLSFSSLSRWLQWTGKMSRNKAQAQRHGELIESDSTSDTVFW